MMRWLFLSQVAVFREATEVALTVGCRNTLNGMRDENNMLRIIAFPRRRCYFQMVMHAAIRVCCSMLNGKTAICAAESIRFV